MGTLQDHICNSPPWTTAPRTFAPCTFVHLNKCTLGQLLPRYFSPLNIWINAHLDNWSIGTCVPSNFTLMDKCPSWQSTQGRKFNGRKGYFAQVFINFEPGQIGSFLWSAKFFSCWNGIFGHYFQLPVHGWNTIFLKFL